MADKNKPRVTWYLKDDGMRPAPAPHGFVGRNPVQRTIMPRQRIEIDLQITANVPLLCYPTRKFTAATSNVVPWIVMPGSSVTVTVVNESEVAALVIDDKEVLVNMTPMLFDGTDEVG